MKLPEPILDQVFILRFWREGGDDGRWRVLVRNINTRRRHVVDDVQRAFAIVAANLGAAAEAETASGESESSNHEC